MKKIFALFTFATFLLSVLVACGGSGETTETTTAPTRKKRADVPAWFLMPPQTEDAIYSVGYAKKQNMQLALTTAANRARDELSRVLGVKVSNMVKDFMEEGTVGSDSEKTGQTIEFSSSVSKSITSNSMSLTQISQQELYELDNGYFEGFVLIKLAITDMSSKIDEVMKNNAAAFAKLAANKSFDELDKELKSLKGTDPALKPAEGNPEETEE